MASFQLSLARSLVAPLLFLCVCEGKKKQLTSCHFPILSSVQFKANMKTLAAAKA